MTAMSNETQDTALEDANKDRALIYLAIFRELRSRFGEPEAIDILRTVLYRHGRRFGETLTRLAPRDFDGLIESFAKAPDGGQMFQPRIDRQGTHELAVTFMSCPLKSAWREAGLDDSELLTMLHCASAMDSGTMDAAGFDLDIRTWQPGEDGCCRLVIREKGSAVGSSSP
jgi:hypothetical protein